MTATLETTKTQAATDAQAIIETYWTLTTGAGHPVRLLAIAEMFDWDIPRFHAALLHLARTEIGTVFIEPEPKLRSLTEMDHLVEVRIGGDVKHVISIER